MRISPESRTGGGANSEGRLIREFVGDADRESCMKIFMNRRRSKG
jgi:hypothetical protein